MKKKKEKKSNNKIDGQKKHYQYLEEHIPCICMYIYTVHIYICQ